MLSAVRSSSYSPVISTGKSRLRGEVSSTLARSIPSNLEDEFNIPEGFLVQLGKRKITTNDDLSGEFDISRKRLQLRNDGGCISEVERENYIRKSDQSKATLIHKTLSSGKVINGLKCRKPSGISTRARSRRRAQLCYSREVENHKQISNPRIAPIIRSYEYTCGAYTQCHIWQPYGGADLNKAHDARPDGLSMHHWMDYLLQSFEGIEYMHKRGFIHRDLKPGNIVVDENEFARLIDLGFSGRLNQRTSLTNKSGTPYYRAPEVWVREEQNEAADVYAAGMTMVRALELCGLMKPQPKERLKQSWPVQWVLTSKGVEADINDLLQVLQRMTAEDSVERPSMAEARECLSDAWGPILVD